MVIVGSSVVVGKLVVARCPPFLLAGLRFALASLILLPLLRIAEGRIAWPARHDAAVLALQAFTGIFVFNALLLYGLQLTTAAASGIVTSTTPAVAAALAWLVLGERPSPRSAAGIVLAVAGVAAVGARATGEGGGSNPLAGTLLVSGAVVGEAAYVVCGKVASRRVTPLMVATAITVLGSLMFLPFAALEAWRFDFSRLGAGDWVAIGYYGVAVTVVAFVLWARGITRVPASTAGVFTGLLPLSALALSYTVLGERFAWSHAVGGACVLAGIGLVAYRGDRASVSARAGGRA